MPTNNAKVKIVYISASSYDSLVSGNQIEQNSLYIIHDENNSDIGSKIAVGGTVIVDNSYYAVHTAYDTIYSLIEDFVGSGDNDIYWVTTDDSSTTTFEFTAETDIFEGTYIIRWQGSVDEETERPMIMLYKAIADIQEGDQITSSNFYQYIRHTDLLAETQFDVLSGGDASSF